MFENLPPRYLAYICVFHFICAQFKINVLILFHLLNEFSTAGYHMSQNFHMAQIPNNTHTYICLYV